MKLPRSSKAGESNNFVDAFNAASEQEQCDFLVEVLTEDEELRAIFLAGLRRRGLLA